MDVPKSGMREVSQSGNDEPTEEVAEEDSLGHQEQQWVGLLSNIMGRETAGDLQMLKRQALRMAGYNGIVRTKARKYHVQPGRDQTWRVQL